MNGACKKLIESFLCTTYLATKQETKHEKNELQ